MAAVLPLDDETVQSRGDLHLTLGVTGMSCTSCAARVERALRAVPGVVQASVNAALERADIDYDAQRVGPGSLVAAIREAGYNVTAERLALKLGGMTCSSCAGRVEKSLREEPAVLDASVNLALESADVTYLPELATPDEIVAAVEAAGYQASIAGDGAAEPDDAARASRHDRIELIAAALLTTPLLLQMGAMAAGSGWHLPVWLEVALATPVQFWIGRRFYLGAWRATRARTGSMDQLVALGTSAAWTYSMWLVLRHGAAAGGSLYFEASAVIITLILAGKFMESRARRSAASALRALMSLRPERARVLRDGVATEIGIADVAPGDTVVVRPGERLPVDGEIIRGESELDEQLVTGEAMPVLRRVGDTGIAGAMNGSGLLHLRAERVGKDTTLARIARLVEQAQAGKAPIQRLVDRISAVFVPLVLLAATIAFTGWLIVGGTMEQALVAAISVLVVACPCALGLATPTALVAGTGSAARAGILVRDIEALERAQAIDTVVFDKTGTLTHGKPALRLVRSFKLDEDVLLRLAATAQAGSEHPLGRTLVEAAAERGLAVGEPESFKAMAGEGIEAMVEGAMIRIGRPAFVAPGGDPDSDLHEEAARLEEEACTVVWLARDGTLEGFFALTDTLRSDSKAAVAELHRRGIRTVLLTGDNRRTAARIAREAGIDEVEAEIRPAGKAAFIERLRGEGRKVAMVGDGINDAPALAAADVGIAMGGGADVALQTAGITLMRAIPSLVPAALDVATVTSRKIRQNLFWAFIYNTGGIPIAAFGLLSPAIAGAAMAFSSVSVVLNSLLLKRWEPKIGGNGHEHR